MGALPLIVRAAAPADAAAIASVHVRTWQGAYAHVFPEEGLRALPVERREAFWHEWLTSPPHAVSVFVAGAEGEVVGFVSVGASRDEEGAGELYAIYVLPEAWGSGAGPALMASALEALRAAGFAEATLWVLADNPRARRFYEREGWRVDGATRREEFLGVEVEEVRYRIALQPPAQRGDA